MQLTLKNVYCEKSKLTQADLKTKGIDLKAIG